MNPEGLRFPDEFCRHKMLDLIGDISLFRPSPDRPRGRRPRRPRHARPTGFPVPPPKGLLDANHQSAARSNTPISATAEFAAAGA